MTKKQTLQNLIEGVMGELKKGFIHRIDGETYNDLVDFIRNNLIKIAKATAEAGRVEEKDLDDVEFNLEKYLTGRKWSEITSGKIKDIIYSAGQKSGFNQAIQEQQQKLKEFFGEL